MIKISEDTLQRQCIAWFKLQYRDFKNRVIHCPNGGSRNAIEAHKLKAMGVLPGVCDVIVTVPRGNWCGLFVELKVGNNSLSIHQEAFIKEHEQDYSCHIVWTFEQFQSVVNNYLSLPKRTQLL